MVQAFERVAGTYVLTLLGLLLADGASVTHLGAWKAAAVAAVPAALSALKSVIGSFIGDRSTVAWLPRRDAE